MLFVGGHLLQFSRAAANNWSDTGARLSLQHAATANQQPRRGSFDERPPAVPLKANSIKQRLRQRRFSIAIGEQLPLRTIKENIKLQDAAAAPARDQYQPAARRAGLGSWMWLEDSSVQIPSITADTEQQQQQQYWCPRRSATAEPVWTAGAPHSQQQHQSSTSGTINWMQEQQQPATRAAAQDQPPSLALYRADCDASRKRDNSRRSVAAAVPRVHGLDLHSRQPEAALEQHGWLNLLQHMARSAEQDAPTPWQQQQQQQRPQVLQVHHPQVDPQDAQVQQQLWQYLQQQEMQLQSRCEQDALLQQDWQMQHAYEVSRLPTPATSCSTRISSMATSRPSSYIAHQLPCWAPPAHAVHSMAEHTQALSALRVIESELQQLLHMQDWLADARSVACPGSRAAAACDSAILQHQVVLQQAVTAREAIQAAVFEAAAALGQDFMPMYHAAAAAGPDDMAAMCDNESHYDFSCREGFDEEPLYPADAESLLQHFGHYAII